MTIDTIIIQVITSLIGTMGFGFLFNVRGKKLIFVTIGGALSWLLFLVLGFWIENEPVRYFIVSLCSTTYAEILARILKTPATTFSILTLVALIPGGSLYYTMTTALNGNMEMFIPKLIHTVELAVALSLGLVIVTALFKRYTKLKQER